MFILLKTQTMTTRRLLSRSPLLIMCLMANFSIAQTVTVTSGGHTAPATSNVITYSAQCPGAGYEIRILKKPGKQMQFVVDEGARRTFDISETQFGKNFLSKPLYGNFGIGCANKGMVLSFMGVELQKEGQPKAVSYHFIIGNDGKVSHDPGLTVDSFHAINSYLVEH